MAEKPPAAKLSPRFLTAAVALPRIQAIVTSASAIWFSQIGYLAFITVTLLSVSDLDFFSVTARISLPLLGVTIPTETFFYIAPWLAAVLHIYFHLVLMRLWDAVAEAPPSVGNLPLGERVAPWLVVDWALRRRSDYKKATTPHRPLTLPGTLATGFLIWFATPFIIGLFWWRSMPAHDIRMTLAIAAALLVSLIVSVLCRHRSIARLSHPGLLRDDEPKSSATLSRSWRAALSIASVAIVMLSAFRTEVDTRSDLGWVDWSSLVPIDLTGAQRPADWREWDYGRTLFLAVWCRDYNPAIADCQISPPAGFDLAWKKENEAYLGNITHLTLIDRDLRKAIASGAFLPGAGLVRARLEGVDFSDAWLPGAAVSGAQLLGANLSRAKLQSADFRNADLSGANLSGARLEGANFDLAQLRGANLQETQRLLTHLHGATLHGADLRGAEGLTQDQLKFAVGDEATKLPQPLYVCTCLSESTFSEFEEKHLKFEDTKSRVRNDLKCPDSTPPRRISSVPNDTPTAPCAD